MHSCAYKFLFKSISFPLLPVVCYIHTYLYIEHMNVHYVQTSREAMSTAPTQETNAANITSEENRQEHGSSRKRVGMGMGKASGVAAIAIWRARRRPTAHLKLNWQWVVAAATTMTPMACHDD